MPRIFSLLRRLGAAGCALVAVACSGGDLVLPEEATPAEIEMVSGDGQTGSVGTVLLEPLVVRVTNQVGNAAQGVRVEWTASPGSINPAATSTDADGRASTRLTLGGSPGGNVATALVSGVGTVAFTATATAIGGGGGGGGDDGGGAGGGDDEGGGAGGGDDGGGGNGDDGGGGTGGGGGGDDGSSDASRLNFKMQPSSTEEDKEIRPPVQVEVLDQQGNRVTDRGFTIRLELVGGDARARLKGDASRATNEGVATFDDLKVDRAGTGYRLHASAEGLPPIESNPFNVFDD